MKVIQLTPKDLTISNNENVKVISLVKIRDAEIIKAILARTRSF